MDRLTVYIESCARILPEDHYKYADSNDCVFCTNEFGNGEGFIVQKWIKGNRMRTGAKCCQTCFDKISNSIVMELDYSVIGPYNYHRDLRLENMAQVTFSNDVSNFYIHNKENAQHTHCYACMQPTQGNRAKIVEVPVDYDSDMVGGKIHLCATCDAAYYPLNGGSYTPSEQEHIDYSVCAQCREHYLITSCEKVYRHLEGNKDYMCPKCTHSNLPYRLGKLNLQEYSNQRIIIQECKGCIQAQIWDLMSLDNFTCTEFCKDCLLNGFAPIVYLKKKQWSLLVYPPDLFGHVYRIKKGAQTNAGGKISIENYKDEFMSILGTLNWYAE